MVRTLEHRLKETSFEMFSKQGDNVVRRLVSSIMKKIGGKQRVTKEDVVLLISTGQKVINNGGHGEIYDTEPEQHIIWFVNQKLKETGYSFRIEYGDF